MKLKIFVAALLVVLSIPLSLVNAGIESWSCDDDGDGAIVMATPTMDYNSTDDEYKLSMDGVQTGYPAHVLGDFNAPSDPKVWILESIENDTTFAWTDYHITIGMTQSFTIPSVITPEDWSFTVTQPIAGNLPNGGGPGWIGTIDYYAAPAGSPIVIGDSGDFGFKVVFVGVTAFCTEQYPTPEPATMALLCIGALALRRKK